MLAICYSDEEISPYLPLTRQSLLTMPAGNACWLIAGLLTTADRIAWATACAKRAHGYAAASENGAAAAAAMAVAAEYAADTTAKAAARAARAAQYAAAAMAAAHYADAAVSATSEYRRAIEHGADLLGLPA